MDIVAIEEAIQSLENADTTVNNVAELASLYICRDNLQRGLNRQINAIEGELEDILPYYLKYKDIKKRYQLHQTTESEVITGIKGVCNEIEDFINALYSGTDMNKERICIRKMLEKLYGKYSK